jgi:SET domain-containing protein
MSKQTVFGFDKMLKDLNITKEQLNIITHTGEIIEFKSNFYYKKKSTIHGYGVFALKDINKKDIIGIGSIDNRYKTTLGRFTNHSDLNNAMFYYLKNNDVVMVATKNISKDTEILINYRDHVLNKIYLNGDK